MKYLVGALLFSLLGIHFFMGGFVEKQIVLGYDKKAKAQTWERSGVICHELDSDLHKCLKDIGRL